MRPTLKFVFLTALRDRLFMALFGLIGIALAVSLYMGGVALTEKSETAVVFAAGAVRVLLVFGVVVFAAFHLQRLFESREIEALLSRAISREKFVLAYWAGLAVTALLLLVPVALVLTLFSADRAGALLWSGSVLAELAIVLAFTVFAGITLERALSAIFATVGFYALSRMMSFFLAISDHAGGAGANPVADPVITAISVLMPRLDLMGQTRWLAYGAEPSDPVLLLAVQALVFVPLLLAAAMFDLRRKFF